MRIRMTKMIHFFLFFVLAFGSMTFTAKAVAPLDEVKSYVKNYYYPGITTNEVNNSQSIEALMQKLDVYSIYMTAEEYNQFENTVEMKLVGIGVVIQKHAQGLYIEEVLVDSPAQQAKLEVGDIITKIGNKTLNKMNLNDSMNLLRGKEQTKVTVTVYRSKTKKSFTKTMTRKTIKLANVESKLLAGNVGYIKLNSFSTTSTNEIQAAMKEMPTAKSWILDLRDNGGGDIEAAEKLVGMFPKAKIAYFMKFGQDTNYYFQEAIKQKRQFSNNVAVLMNKNAASASEMIAAAVKGQKAAKVYGQTSYGKGVMQGIFELKNANGFVKLTMAEFFGVTVLGQPIKINKKGVTPNVKTTIGQEMNVSHHDFLKKYLQKDQALKAITVKANTDKITISPSEKYQWSTMKNSTAKVLPVGGSTIKTTVHQTTNKQLKITTNNKLKKGTTYYLRMTSKSGKAAYVKITPK